MIYCFDLDGTITIETEGFGDYEYTNRTPNSTLINIVRKLYSDGHCIIIHTARFLEDEKVTLTWLEKHKIPFHKLILGKPQADYYIDDKNILISQLFIPKGKN